MLWFQKRITCFERPKKMCYHVEDNSIMPLKHEIGEITIEPMNGKSRPFLREIVGDAHFGVIQDTIIAGSTYGEY